MGRDLYSWKDLGDNKMTIKPNKKHENNTREDSSKRIENPTSRIKIDHKIKNIHIKQLNLHQPSERLRIC